MSVIRYTFSAGHGFLSELSHNGSVLLHGQNLFIDLMVFENHLMINPAEIDEIMAQLNPESASEILDIRQSHTDPNGDVVYSVLSNGEGELQEDEEQRDFYENLAEKMEKNDLMRLGYELLEDIETDRASRSEWEQDNERALKLLYSSQEFRDDLGNAFFKPSAAIDSTLSIALINNYAVLMTELFPAGGPAKTEIFGDINEKSQKDADVCKSWTNYFLTIHNKSYYPDSEKLILNATLYGSAFRKVYQNPLKREPSLNYISPYNLIINTDTTDILSSSRITAVVKLGRKEIVLRQNSGDFIDAGIKVGTEDDPNSSSLEDAVSQIDGTTKSADSDSLFTFYECHVDLTDSRLKGVTESSDSEQELQKPYIVTICSTTKHVVAIRRNWKENDETYSRLEYFVHYYYLPGLGLYGTGLLKLLASDSTTLTKILRCTLDSEYFRIFPGGFKLASTYADGQDGNDVGIMPGEFRDIRVNSQDIRAAVMPMPFNGASQEILALRSQLREEAAALGVSAQAKIPELGSNAPVGTTLTMVEIMNRVQSVVVKSFQKSLGNELQLLFKIFKELFPEDPYEFMVPGKTLSISRQNFTDQVSIVPVADPNVLTSTHRMIRDESVLKVASMFPDMHNLYEVLHRMYVSMKVEHIDKILPAPPKSEALDPTTENMLILNGREVIVGEMQDHQTHIIAHQALGIDPIAQVVFQANPRAYTEWRIHMQMHKAMNALQILQQQAQEQQMQNMQQMEMMGGMDPMMQQQMQMQMAQPQVMDFGAIQGNLQESQGMQMKDKAEALKEVLLIPEVQNIIAQQDAEEFQKQQQDATKQQQEAMEQQNMPLIMDIQQRDKAAVLRDEEMKRKHDFDVMKANLEHEEFMKKIALEMEQMRLKHEIEMARIESQRDISTQDNLVDLVIEEHKGNQEFEKNLGEIYEKHETFDAS